MFFIDRLVLAHVHYKKFYRQHTKVLIFKIVSDNFDSSSLYSISFAISACNAMETLLIHEDLMSGDIFNNVCNMLKREGVKIYSGPKLNQQLTFGPPAAKSLKHEYGSLECCIEIVKDLDEAIDHIHTFGSGHTDVIVTENGKRNILYTDGKRFIDSRIVIGNFSTNGF